jgi:hypothetical protein
MRAFLADLILFIHFGVASFIVLGLGLTWLGIALSWRWVRNFWFRLAHLSAIVCVALEALAGIVCPLTLWEDALRKSVGEQPSFVARWVQRLLFYELPEWVFTSAYVGVAVAAAITWLLAPPRRSRSR